MFFFHPAVAKVILDVIQALDPNKREPEVNNFDVFSRIVNELPDVFSSLGHPCIIGEVGGVWSCVMDKLDSPSPMNVY